MKFAPVCPSGGGPLSISQELGASTLMTGTGVVSRMSIICGNGSRSGPLNEKPKIASTTRSAVPIDWWKSEVKGTERLVSWAFSLYFCGEFIC